MANLVGYSELLESKNKFRVGVTDTGECLLHIIGGGIDIKTGTFTRNELRVMSGMMVQASIFFKSEDIEAAFYYNNAFQAGTFHWNGGGIDPRPFVTLDDGDKDVYGSSMNLERFDQREVEVIVIGDCCRVIRVFREEKE